MGMEATFFGRLGIVEIRQTGKLILDLPLNLAFFPAGARWVNKQGLQFGFLSVQSEVRLTKSRLIYDISSCCSLMEFCSAKSKNETFVEGMRQRINNMIQLVKDNGYIDFSCILCGEDYIFIDGDLELPRFIYVPIKLSKQTPARPPDNDSLSRSAHLTEQTVLLNQFETRVSLQPQNFFGPQLIPTEWPYLIGKASSCDGFIAGNPTISRNHCLIDHVEGMYQIKDLHSLNGTYLNDKKLTVDTFYPLMDGDEIRLSDYIYRLRISDPMCQT